MKTLIWICFIAAIGSIVCGFVLDVPYNEKLIGFGVVGLFLVVFPLFIYYRWKNRSLKDYMITKESIDKMRANQNRKEN